jgi:hypothetical protein
LELAYTTLGVKPSDVAAVPQITHIIKQSFKRGIDDAILYLKASEEEEAKKFLRTWSEFSPTMHRKLPFEAFCVAASVRTKRILEILVSSCYDDATTAVKLITAVNHPKVVQATVKNAMKAEGAADRKMLHLHKGFLPVPRNNTNIFQPGAKQLQLQDNSNHATQNNFGSDGKPLDPAIGNNKETFNPNAIGIIEGRMNRISDRYNQGLSAATPPPEEHISEAVEAEWAD